MRAVRALRLLPHRCPDHPGGEKAAMSRTRKNRLAPILLALVCMVPYALAQQVTVHHAQGETTLEQNPATVFSYDYAAIDTLHTLGVDVDGAPPLAGAAPSWLPSGLVNIGSLFEPDY